MKFSNNLGNGSQNDKKMKEVAHLCAEAKSLVKDTLDRASNKPQKTNEKNYTFQERIISNNGKRQPGFVLLANNKCIELVAKKVVHVRKNYGHKVCILQHIYPTRKQPATLV